MSSDSIKERIRTIPDHPKPGIQFRDITTLLQDPVGLHLSVQQLANAFKGVGVAKVAGTVTQVQSSAARSTLDQPLEEVFSFKCGQCGTDHRFSRKALTLIESSPSRLWACPRCGASYALGQQGGPDAAEKKDNGSTGAF